MSIREWFNFKGTYNDTAFNNSLDVLLRMYATSLSKYLGLEFENHPNVESVLTKAMEQELNTGQELFIHWYLQKGQEKMLELCHVTQVQNEDDAIAEIAYEQFILESELDFEYPEDVRSCLIGITLQLISTFKKTHLAV